LISDASPVVTVTSIAALHEKRRKENEVAKETGTLLGLEFSVDILVV